MTVNGSLTPLHKIFNNIVVFLLLVSHVTLEYGPPFSVLHCQAIVVITIIINLELNTRLPIVSLHSLLSRAE